jgi:hypothetical protein
MSPEIILEDESILRAHPFASDIYAYAILAWEILTGGKAYGGSATRQGGAYRLLIQVVKGLRPEIPGEKSRSRSESQRSGSRVDMGEDGEDGLPVVVWPAEVATMVRKCWQKDAANRPDFGWVGNLLHRNEAAFHRTAMPDPALAPGIVWGCEYEWQEPQLQIDLLLMYARVQLRMCSHQGVLGT